MRCLFSNGELTLKGERLADLFACPAAQVAVEEYGAVASYELELTPRELLEFVAENGGEVPTWEEYVELAMRDREPSNWQQQKAIREALEANGGGG